jgi:hypothetical protein
MVKPAAMPKAIADGGLQGHDAPSCCVNHKKCNFRDQNAARGRLVGLPRPDDAANCARSMIAGDTSDTVFVVNGGRSTSWQATDPKLEKCLKQA